MLRTAFLALCMAVSAAAMDNAEADDVAIEIGYGLEHIVRADEWSTANGKEIAWKWRQPAPSDWDVYYRLAFMKDLWTLADTGAIPKEHAPATEVIGDAPPASAEWTAMLQQSLKSVASRSAIPIQVRSKIETLLKRHRARPFASSACFPQKAVDAFPAGVPTGAPKALPCGWYDSAAILDWLKTGAPNRSELPIDPSRLLALVGSDAKADIPNIVVGSPAPGMPPIGLYLRVVDAKTVYNPYATSSRPGNPAYVAVACPSPKWDAAILDRIIATP